MDILKLIDIRFAVLVILLLELWVLTFLVFALLFRRSRVQNRLKREIIERQKISEIIISCLQKKPTDLATTGISKYALSDVLLSVIEQFDRRLSGGEWEKLKREIMEKYLIPKTRRWSKSRSWKKRNFTARCFALCPQPEQAQDILRLVDDPDFLVRSFAAIAAIEIKSKDGVHKILEQMSQNQGYTHAYYRDILLQSKSLEIFRWIEEMAASEADLSLHVSCLDVLAGTTLTINLPFLRQDLHSPNLKVRLAAVKVFANNLQVDSMGVLTQSLDDPNEDIRAAAILGIEHFASPNTLLKLTEALSDPCWTVRIQAAQSLKKMGLVGKRVLEKQDPLTQQAAYEAAQYALTFDW